MHERNSCISLSFSREGEHGWSGESGVHLLPSLVIAWATYGRGPPIEITIKSSRKDDEICFHESRRGRRGTPSTFLEKRIIYYLLLRFPIPNFKHSSHRRLSRCRFPQQQAYERSYIVGNLSAHFLELFLEI